MEHLERTKHQHAAMTAEPSDTGTSVRTRLDNRTVFLFSFFSSFLFLFHIIVGDSWVPSISEPAQVPESPYFTFETFLFIENFLPSSPQGCNKKEVQTVRLCLSLQA